MRKKHFLFIILLFSAFFQSCAVKEKAAQKYVNLDADYSVVLKNGSGPLNTVVTDYVQDSTNREMFNFSQYTFSDKFLYTFDMLGTVGDHMGNIDPHVMFYRIDLQSGEVYPLCQSPGCNHSPNEVPPCIVHDKKATGFQHSVAVGNHLYYVYENKIIMSSSDDLTGGETVFENDFCTEFCKQNYNENDRYALISLYPVDGYFYAFGYNYVIKINKETLKTEKTIELFDTQLFSVYFYEGDAYAVNELYELYKVSFDDESVTKIFDRLSNGRLTFYEDSFFYLSDDNRLVRVSMDSKQEQIFDKIDFCSYYWLVKDSKIFYSDKQMNFKSFDIKTEEDKLIYDKFSPDGKICVVSADHIDRVFAVGEDEKTRTVIYSVKTDGSAPWEVTLDGTE